MYNGLAGGLGQGLSSFVSAYQTALNYQLEKAKAASLSDYQNQMAQVASKNAATQSAAQQAEAQYQQALGSAAGQNSVTERAKALKEYLELGNGVGEYYAPELMDQRTLDAEKEAAQGIQSNNSVPSSQQTMPPAPKGLINPLPPGMIGPQPSPQMVQTSQADAQTLQNQPVNPLARGLVGPQPSLGMIAQSKALQGQGQAVQSAPQLPLVPWNNGAPRTNNPSGPPPSIVPLWQRQMLLEGVKATQAKQNESDEKGLNQRWIMNPQTFQPQLASAGPYTGDALLAQKQKEAELLNLGTNQRSGNITTVNQFNEDADVKSARTSTPPMNRLLGYMSNKNMSPSDKEAAFVAAISVLNPEIGPNAKSMDDIMQSPGITDQLKNQIMKIKGEGLDNNTLNQAIRTAAQAQISNVQGMQKASQYAKSQMQFRGTRPDPGLDVNPSVLSAYNGARKLLKSVPQYISPSAESQSGFRNLWGTLNNANSNASQVPNPNVGPHGNSVTQNGHTYIWNPKTKSYQ